MNIWFSDINSNCRRNVFLRQLLFNKRPAPFSRFIISVAILFFTNFAANGQNSPTQPCTGAAQRYRLFFGGDTSLRLIKAYPQDSHTTYLQGVMTDTQYHFQHTVLLKQDTGNQVVWVKSITLDGVTEGNLTLAGVTELPGSELLLTCFSTATNMPSLIWLDMHGEVLHATSLDFSMAYRPQGFTFTTGLRNGATVMDNGNIVLGLPVMTNKNNPSGTVMPYFIPLITVLDKTGNVIWANLYDSSSEYYLSPANVSSDGKNVFFISAFHYTGLKQSEQNADGYTMAKIDGGKGDILLNKSFIFLPGNPDTWFANVAGGFNRWGQSKLLDNGLIKTIDWFDNPVRVGAGSYIRPLFFSFDQELTIRGGIQSIPFSINKPSQYINTVYTAINKKGLIAISQLNGNNLLDNGYAVIDSVNTVLRQKKLRSGCDVNVLFNPFLFPALQDNNRVAIFKNAAMQANPQKVMVEVMQNDVYDDLQNLSACAGTDTAGLAVNSLGYLPSGWAFSRVSRDVLVETPAFAHSAGLSVIKQVTCGCGAGCDSIRITGPTTLCTGQTGTYTVHKGPCYPATGYLLDTAVNKLQVIDDTTFQVTVHRPGDFPVKAFTGVCRVLSDSLFIHVTGTLPPVSLGRDTVLCSGALFTLRPAYPYTRYSWQDGTTADQYPVTKAGIYSVTVADSCGNTSSDTIQIAFTTPGRPIIGQDTVLCPGTSDTLRTAIPFTTYRWQDGSDKPYLIVGNPGDYYVTVNNRDCAPVTSDTVHISFRKPVPPVSLGRDTGVCAGISLMLRAGNSYRSYLWQDGSSKPFFRVDRPGLYYVTATDSCGNTTADSIHIAYTTGGQLNRIAVTVCAGDGTDISLPPGFASYAWAPADGLDNPNARVARASPARSTDYTVTVVTTAGCTMEGVVAVTVHDCVDSLYMPNAFTPNGDGVNDRVHPFVPAGVTGYFFSIYNRLGQLVFHSQQPGEGWDGAVKGQLQTPGTYVWFCRFRNRFGRMYSNRGFLILVK